MFCGFKYTLKTIYVFIYMFTITINIYRWQFVSDTSLFVVYLPINNHTHFKLPSLLFCTDMILEWEIRLFRQIQFSRSISVRESVHKRVYYDDLLCIASWVRPDSLSYTTSMVDGSTVYWTLNRKPILHMVACTTIGTFCILQYQMSI